MVSLHVCYGSGFIARYIKHIPGKHLYTADAIPRAPVEGSQSDDNRLQEEIETFVDGVTEYTLAATKQHLDVSKAAQEICLPGDHRVLQARMAK